MTLLIQDRDVKPLTRSIPKMKYMIWASSSGRSFARKSGRENYAASDPVSVDEVPSFAAVFVGVLVGVLASFAARDPWDWADHGELYGGYQPRQMEDY